MMKKFLTLFAAIFCSFQIVQAENIASASNDEIENKKVIILRKAIKQHVNRSGFPDVMASYDNVSETIELNCRELKETAIYILTSSGELVYSEIIDGSLTEFYWLGVPSISGTYYLVIDSPVLYAEGVFAVE